MYFYPTATAAAAGGGAAITGWSAVEWYNGTGANYFTYTSGLFTIIMPGRYKITAATVMPNISGGVADMYLFLGATWRNSAIGLLGGQFITWQAEYSDVPVAANTVTKVTLQSGGITVHNTSSGAGPGYRGEFSIIYLGPNLVSS
jgi:hypothetical protein